MNPDANTVAIFHPLSLNFYGGGEVSIMNISKGLEQAGIGNVIYEDDAYSGLVRVDDSFLRREGVRFERVKMSNGSRLHNLLFQPMPLAEMLDEHTVNLIMLRRVPRKSDVRECNRSNSKKIFLFHGIGLERLRLNNPVIMAYQIYMRLQLLRIRKLLINGQNFFQVLNSFQEGFLLKLGIPAERIFLIENGMKFDGYAVRRNDSNFQVLFIGRTENLQKGIKRLLRVAKLSRKRGENITFKVVGSGSYNFRSRDLSLVSYLGFVPEERKLAELSESNLLIMTSNMETFGLSLIEGLFSGLPAVTTPVSGPTTILRHSQDFGTVSTFSSKKLSEDVLKYYEKWKFDPSRYFEEKIKRSTNSKTYFGVARMIYDYAKMINAVMSAE